MKKILWILLTILILSSCTNNNLDTNKNRANTTKTNTQNTKINNTKNTKEIKTAIIYDDARCKDCYTNEIIKKLRQIPTLKNTNFIVKDYKKDPEIKKFLQEYKWITLPVIIFDTNNIDPSLNKYLNKEKDSNKYFLVAWRFDPISLDKLEARPETKNTLDVFVMWYCPFWEIALKALPQIEKTFKNDNTKINIHYIADKIWTWITENDFNSLHWPSEAWEDLRQVCINKYYGTKKLISYAVERYKNADNYWRITDKPEDAMKAVWIDSKKIDNCVKSGEASKLLEEDIKLAKELNINASPTWLANNKYKFGWIQAQNIQSQFCKYNPNLKGCKVKIEQTQTTKNWAPACWK